MCCMQQGRVYRFVFKYLGVVSPVCICKRGRLHTAAQSMFAASTLQPSKGRQLLCRMAGECCYWSGT